MAPSFQERPCLSRQDAQKAVKSILAKSDTAFRLVPFKEFRASHQGSSLTSKQYQQYLVLCHSNSLYHAGWIVCPYIASGFCNVDKGLFEINTRKGGTNRFGRHIYDHEHSDIIEGAFQGQLNLGCRQKISDAAALAVVLDLRPLGFAENRDGMAAYAKAVFESGQSIPVGIQVDPKSYLPSRTAVKSSMDRLHKRLRERFLVELQTHLLEQGGAVSVDGVTLKLQGRSYYDFTVHHVCMKRPQNVVSFPTFSIRATTILFLEGPSRSDAISLRNMLNDNLQKEYGIDLHAFQKTFTVVTDGAANMARMAGSSISRRVAALDQRWMRCFVHVLSNAMKDAVRSCSSDPCLLKISQDFKCMKEIVRDAKQGGWNHILPNGYRLIQESETRFGTHFLVARRFLKSAESVKNLIASQNRVQAQHSFESIEKLPPPALGYPTIEALVDALKPVFEATVEFETAHEPTLHKVLPALQHCLTELSRIERGGSVVRENNQVLRPSLYSMRMCGVMKNELLKIEIHDLWLSSCFLFPFLRGMEFWENESQRANFRMRAESLTRSMCEPDSMELESMPSRSQQEHQQSGDNGTQFNPREIQRAAPTEMLGKRKFCLIDHVSSTEVSGEHQDEVTRYKETPLSQMGIDRSSILSDPFFVLKFWYGRRRSFPKLYKVAMRVFATPASSCASERVFSIVNKLVTADRSVLSTQHISQIIVSRSLRPYEE